jgi:hypothetical protein
MFHAYVGTGQMVDPFETDQLMYAESLRDAKSRGDGVMVTALEDLGAPPYESTLDYPVAIASNRKLMNFQHGPDCPQTSRRTVRCPILPSCVPHRS